MHRDRIGKLGLAAVILLMPGGFVLGATLIARRWHAKRGLRDAEER